MARHCGEYWLEPRSNRGATFFPNLRNCAGLRGSTPLLQRVVAGFVSDVIEANGTVTAQSFDLVGAQFTVHLQARERKGTRP